MSKMQCAGHLLLCALVIYQVTMASTLNPYKVLGYVPRNHRDSINGNPLESCKAYHGDGFKQSAIYKLDLPTGGQFEVFCDMVLRGGGYTVIQRRVDDTTPFDRGQAAYKNGFGQPGGNYWLGLEKIHRILTHGPQFELYIGMEKFPTANNPLGDLVFARYTNVTVTSEADDYTLYIGDFVDVNTGTNVDDQSTAIDALSCHSGTKFQYSSGWWENSCSSSQLNGFYYDDGVIALPVEGIQWDSASGLSLKTVVMAVRPYPF